MTAAALSSNTFSNWMIKVFFLAMLACLLFPSLSHAGGLTTGELLLAQSSPQDRRDILVALTSAESDSNQNTLTIGSTPTNGGTTSPVTNGSISEDSDATVSISATPAACYKFVKWDSTNQYTLGHIHNKTSSSTTIDMASRDRAITAVFQYDASQCPSAATLNIGVYPSGGGNTTPSGSTSQNVNTSVGISASPSACYQFLNWTGTDVAQVAAPNSASTSINMGTSSLSITANFASANYTISASNSSGGSISPAGNIALSCGGSKTFTITPATGGNYTVSGLMVNSTPVTCANTGCSYTFSNVTANNSIYAVFSGSGNVASNSIPGCSTSTYTNYNGSFNAADFNLVDTAVINGTISLQTGDQALAVNNIIIPFTQKVGVTFLYENAGFTQTKFGWMLAANGSTGTKHVIYKYTDSNNSVSRNEGVLDDGQCIGGGTLSDGTDCSINLCCRNWSTLDVNGDGTVNMLDSRVVLGTFAGGTELVFYLDSSENGSNGGVFYTKQDWNTDFFNGYCTSSNFNKMFYLGDYSNCTSSSCPSPGNYNCGPIQWMDPAAVNRLGAAPLNLVFGSTTKTISITRGNKFPHVIVGAPDSKPNEWVLGWEDWNTGGDYDINDVVVRIDRQTGGMAQLSSNKAITPSDPNGYFTSVTFETYDNMPCGGNSTINYYVSIDNGANWVEIANWDIVKTFTGSAGSEVIGAAVNNWTPGNPAMTYRMRKIDFASLGLSGNQLVWKAEMTSTDVNCVPQVIDVKLGGTVATHGSFSRASPSVQTNVLYTGSYETAAVNWTDKTLRGHLAAERLYDPADPSVQSVQTLWDAGAVLTSMSPANRTIYFPNVSSTVVTNETVGTGDGTTVTFAGNLTHYPVSALTISINGGIETFSDQHTNVLVGDKGGTGTINRFTGAYNLTFNAPPSANLPIKANYTYYTTSSTLKPFNAGNVTNAMLGIDSTFIYPQGYIYDFNKDGAVTSADGAWLVNWVRGYKDGVSTKKEWLLGAIDHSVPAVETPPGRPAWYFGTAVNSTEQASFDNFATNLAYNRPTVVYVGARDGMLHAFNAGVFKWGYWGGSANNSTFVWGDNPQTLKYPCCANDGRIDTPLVESKGYFQWTNTTSPCNSYACGNSASAQYGDGSELWAFIPANLMSRLKNNYMSGDDQAYVDASPAISDVYINGVWKTVLLCAEGNGGDSVFCLDVTDPTNPHFMWEFSDPDLMRSRSSPAVGVIGRIVSNGSAKWVAFFVSGKSYSTQTYPSIYMIDIADGSVLQRIYLDSEPNGIGGVPSGQPAVVDSDGNGYIDRMYIGTDKGYLYKVTLPDDPSAASSNVTNCVINTDTTDSHGNTLPSDQLNQPIYASPAVVVNNTYSASGAVQYHVEIMYGTGDNPYFDDNPNSANTTYHFFAYVDTAAKGDCGSSGVDLDWLYTLPPGEQVFASAFAAAGAVYFGTATSATEDPCSATSANGNGGNLYVFSINQATDATPITTIHTGNILSAPVVDDSHLYVKTIGNGLLATPGIYNNSSQMAGLPVLSINSWREIFDKDTPLNSAQ
jgi:hypothetical protein